MDWKGRGRIWFSGIAAAVSAGVAVAGTWSDWPEIVRHALYLVCLVALWDVTGGRELRKLRGETTALLKRVSELESHSSSDAIRLAVNLEYEIHGAEGECRLRKELVFDPTTTWTVVREEFRCRGDVTSQPTLQLYRVVNGGQTPIGVSERKSERDGTHLYYWWRPTQKLRPGRGPFKKVVRIRTIDHLSALPPDPCRLRVHVSPSGVGQLTVTVKFAPKYLETIEGGAGGVECLRTSSEDVEEAIEDCQKDPSPQGFTVHWSVESAKGGDCYMLRWMRKEQGKSKAGRKRAQQK